MRKRIFKLVNQAEEGDYASRFYDVFIVIIALLSLVPMMFRYERQPDSVVYFLKMLDIVTAYILIMDYTFRWMTHDYKTGKGRKALFYYPITPMAIIDLLAILPTLGVVPQTLRFLRILRIVKVFRYSRNLVVLTNACYREYKTLLSIGAAALVYVFTVALIVFMCEPEVFEHGFFDAVCWAATSLTTVTFSDERPIGDVGKAISIASSFVALLIVALPAGVITGAYLGEMQKTKEDNTGYFAMVGPAKVRLKDRKRNAMKNRNMEKVNRYAIIILSSIALSAICYFVLSSLGSPVWLVEIGIAMAAFLLEPAAGIVVALVAGAVTSLVVGDPGAILYTTGYVMYALAFGLLFGRDKKFLGTRLLLTLIMLVFGCAFFNAMVAGLLSNWEMTPDALQSTLGVLPMIDAGIDKNIAMAIGFGLDAFAEAICIVFIFSILVKVFGVRAGASEEERARAEELALQEALKEGKIAEEQARVIALETMEKEYRKLTKQHDEIESEIAVLKRQIDEVHAFVALGDESGAKAAEA